MLVDDLKGGLDAPICLTWELTYACNLACVHCLSSSGRRDPAELTTAEARAFIDELADLRVFYINIGGGEPTIRRDFFELIAHAIDRGVGVKFSTNGSRIDAATAAAPRRDGLPGHPDLDRRCHRRGQRRGPWPGELRDGAPGHGTPRRRGFRTVQDLDRRDAPQRRPARRLRRPRRRLRSATAGDPTPPCRSGCGLLGRPPPDTGATAHDPLLAARPSRRAHRRFVLPSQRPGRVAARTEHVRCRSRGVPGRPDRRRVRLPVRHAPRIQEVGRSATPVGSPGSGATRRDSPTSVGPTRRPGRARAVGCTTPARAGAWPPSSSPVFPWRARTPSA